MTDPLTVLLEVAGIQLAITAVAVAVDIGVVFRGFWVPLMRETAPEDRPYLFRGIASFAREARLQAEREARMKPNPTYPPATDERREAYLNARR